MLFLLIPVMGVLGVSPIFCLTSIPVHFFSYSKLPVIEVVIEDKKYLFEIDTGAIGDLILKKEILEQINKKNAGVIKTVDINGNVYESPEFLIANIKIGGIDFSSVTARQENRALLTEGSLVRGNTTNNVNELRFAHIAGRLGWGILKDRKWYFDFLHSLLWIVDDVNELEKEVGYFSVSDYVPVSFEMEETGIVLSVNTSIGIKKFMLDTGANVSCLRESLVQKSYAKEFEPGKWMFLSKITLGGISLGKHPFFLYDFTSLMDIDGFLGTQFFERNGIYLDFQNKRALIAPAEPSFWWRLAVRAKSFWR